MDFPVGSPDDRALNNARVVTGSFEVLLDVRASYDIENDVRAAFLPHDIDKVFAAVVDHPIGTQLAADATAFLGAVSGDHFGTERFAQLYCRRANSARPPVNEEWFTSLELCADED